MAEISTAGSDSANSGAETAPLVTVEQAENVNPFSHGDEKLINAMKLSSYTAKYMTNPYRGNLATDAGKAEKYSSALCDFAVRHLDLNLLMQDRYSSQEYNPVLDELGGLITSFDHNAGIYYEADDVIELFEVIAGSLVKNPDTQEKLRLASESGNVKDFDSAFKDRVEQSFSLDRNVTMAVIKDEEGEWRVVDEREYGSNEDFAPLEIIRQDNADKAGDKKYRFRSTAYTRHQDELHDKEVADGWYTSDWIDEPTYWAKQIRHTLVNGLAAIAEQLDGSGIDLALITEGGVLKGTSTAGTDLDTTCLVLADSETDFDTAYEALAPTFKNELGKLPFNLKNDEGVGSYFMNRTTGRIYFRNSSSGEYMESDWDMLFDGNYIFEIRKHEKGVGVTTQRGFLPFKKPKTVGTDDRAYASINIATGNVSELSGDALESYKAAVKQLKQQRRDESANAPEAWSDNMVW